MARNSRSPILLSLSLVALLGLLTVASSADAQSYPSSTIRIVVPSAAGTPPDILSRLIAHELSRAQGWQVIIENKPGAMQTLGANDVLKQPSDGYTVLAIAMSGSVAPALLPNVAFDLNQAFTPVIKLATASHILVVNPSVPASTLPELVSLLKREPGSLNFSSGGFGTPAHLAGELFKLTAGVEATHVPYQALPQAIGDLLSGRVQFQFITPLPVLNLIAAGKLRALAVTGPGRMPMLENVPTVSELGFPELIIQDWIGLVVKRGTPAEIIKLLNRRINTALRTPAVQQAFAKMGADPVGGTSEDFGRYIASQVTYWAQVVDRSGIRIRK